MKQSTSYRFVQESYDSDRPQPVATKAVESKEIPRNFFKYTVSGPQFRPVGDVVLTETLTPGSYKIGHDMSGTYLEQVKSNTDEMMVFEDSPMHKAVAEIATFWDRKDHYKKLGLMQSRGIILYGPPGSGKSLALQQVGEAMAKKGDIMLMANSPDQISSALSAVRQIEPERRIVVTFEEADELASYDERTLLRLMDGDLKVDRVCYLATTNYIDRLSPRLQRPGRFDKRIYVGPPKFEHRLKYLNHKLKGIAEDSQIQDMAKKTEGLSFGHLRELIAGAFAIGDPVDEVIMRLRDSRNIKESQKQKQKQAVNERMLSELDLYSRHRMLGKIPGKAISEFDSLIRERASIEELMDWGDKNRVWLGSKTELDSDDSENRLGESISKKQLTPVVQSFKAHASRLRPEDGLQTAMGPQAWGLQVDQATQDFENYLSRITKRILGRLKNGEYAPRSAMNNRNRPMDVDDKNRELSKVGSKATRDISKILGV